MVGRGAARVTQIGVLVPPGSLVAHDEIALDNAERHHLRVRRVRVGDRVVCLDGTGVTATGEVVANGSIRVDAVQHHAPPAALVLAVGAGDKDRFVALAERCTELGVTRLIPLATERSRTVQTLMQPAAVARARVRAREACKQSGNPWATVVNDVAPITSLDGSAGIRWFVADAGGSTMFGGDPRGAAGWIVGPEGGLTNDELAWCRDQLRAQVVRLGTHILRFDTAAVAAAVLTFDRRHAGEEAS